MTPVFVRSAEQYDHWYDTPLGSAVLHAECACLSGLAEPFSGRWVEVGVGTGRCAAALGIAEGLDPSPAMLRLAAQRGLRTQVGTAENLPFADHSVDGVLMALALCFVADPLRSLRETHRVLRPQGRLLLGIVPADSPWGRAYMVKASQGHPVYSLAQFLTAAEVLELAEEAGFALLDTASTLFWALDETPQVQPRLERGIVTGAGFLGLLFARSAQAGDCPAGSS